MSGKQFCAIVLVIALAACAQTYRPPTPEELAAIELKRYENAKASIDTQVSAGDYLYAIGLMEPFTDSTQPAVKADAMKVIQSHPTLLAGAKSAIIKKAAESVSPRELIDLLDRTNKLKQKGLISEQEGNSLEETVRSGILSANLNDRARFTLEHKSAVPEFQTEEHLRRLFARSYDQAVGPTTDRVELINLLRLAKEKGPSSEYFRLVQAGLPGMSLSISDLKSGSVVELYPEWTRRELEARSMSVAISTDPPKRLIEEDVLERLKGRSEALSWTRGQHVQGIEVVIKELQYDERNQPPRTETVTVGYYQVDVLTAALLLPRNASVLFEVTQGSSEIEYAYELVAKEKGKLIGEKLLRSKAADNYRQCSNMRTQNVFGGVQPLGVWPNDQVKNFCSSGSGPAGTASLRSEIIANIANEIMRLPPIAMVVDREKGSTAAGQSGTGAVGELDYVKCRMPGGLVEEKRRKTCRIFGGKEV